MSDHETGAADTGAADPRRNQPAPSEDKTLDRLLAAIRVEADDPDLSWSGRPRPVSGGFWARIWQVRLDRGPLEGRDLIARVMPEPTVAAREIAVQTHLASVGFPTPAVHLAGGPGSDLDQAWMLMDHAPGAPLLDDLSVGRTIVGLPRFATALPDQLARHAAALHRLDATPLVDRFGTETDVDALLTELRDQADAVGATRLADAARSLSAERPDGPVVVCHGDLHPFNVLSHSDGDTVLDWTNTRLTQPAFDVAHTKLLLSHPPLPVPPRLRPVLAAAGRVLARRFERTYERLAPHRIEPHQLDWYHEFHRIRILTEVASWRHRSRDGEPADHPYGTIGPAIDGGLLDP